MRTSASSAPSSVAWRLTLAIGTFALMIAGASAERVMRVKDGDSIVVMSAGREVNVRIADMDAPELDQPYGREAKDALVSLVGGREVRLELVGGDVYRRIVANVFVGDRDVAAELVGRGFAWVRRAYAPAARLIKLEDDARAARRGLWAQSDPVPPWIWRKFGKDSIPEGAGQAPAPVTPVCGSKTHCHEMSSCEEALAYLHECGLQTIDGDGDGIPCEKLCRYYR